MMGMGMGVGFSAPPPWTPAALGAALFLRSDLGVTTAAGKAATWGDQSGNARNATQAEAAKQLTYAASGGVNDLPYLLGAVGCAMALGGAAIADGAKTIWVVADITVPMRADDVYSFVSIKSATPNLCELLTVSYAGYQPWNYVRDNAGATVPLKGIASALDASPHATIITTTAAAISDWRLDAATPAVVDSGNGSRFTTDIASICGRIDAAGAVSCSWLGRIYEIGVRESELTAPEMALLRGYLLGRYGT